MKQQLLLSICLLLFSVILLSPMQRTDGVLGIVLTVAGIVFGIVGAFLLGTQLRRAR